MFKKIDSLVYKAVIGPFLATLLIGNFVFLMQFVYRKMEELVGKGLEWDILAQFVFYTSTTLIPLSLPLAVLLSSIMAMGNLGERFELAALKSSGVSLMRVLRPLIFSSFLMAGVSFFFLNNVMPYSKLKLSALVYDIQNKKPSMLLQPNVFFDQFDRMVMKVGDKDENNRLYDVLIYDHRKAGQTRVIRADSADMIIQDTSLFMQMHLMSGKLFEDKETKNQYTRFAFDSLNLVIDMSSFALGETDEDLFKSNAKLKNITDLSIGIDSLKREITTRKTALDEDVKEQFYLIKGLTNENTFSDPKEEILPKFRELTIRDQVKVVNNVKPRIRSIMQELSAAQADIDYKEAKLNEHKMAWHEKFALASSCLLLFFIGGPLGALIKKGGFGMPVVVAIVIYILYYIINTISRNMAVEGALTPFLGAWLSTILLLPLAFWLTRMSVQDSTVLGGFNFEFIGKKLQSLFAKKK